MANSNIPFPGYDTRFGNKNVWVGSHYGPKSYATGGETISAAQFGWGGFDTFDPGPLATLSVNSVNQTVPGSVSGTYFVGVSVATTAPDGAVSKVTMKWYVVATGAEVTATTDLSAEKVRVKTTGV